jgi:hypothetical protein
MADTPTLDRGDWRTVLDEARSWARSGWPTRFAWSSRWPGSNQWAALSSRMSRSRPGTCQQGSPCWGVGQPLHGSRLNAFRGNAVELAPVEPV